jgi:hypothetical protein
VSSSANALPRRGQPDRGLRAGELAMRDSHDRRRFRPTALAGNGAGLPTACRARAVARHGGARHPPARRPRQPRGCATYGRRASGSCSSRRTDRHELCDLTIAIRSGRLRRVLHGGRQQRGAADRHDENTVRARRDRAFVMPSRSASCSRGISSIATCGSSACESTSPNTWGRIASGDRGGGQAFVRWPGHADGGDRGRSSPDDPKRAWPIRS